MKVVLQNVSGKDNKCFYYAFFGAARDYLKKCKYFKKNKIKINVDYLKKENLNFDDIASNQKKLNIFQTYISNTFLFYKEFVNEIKSTDNIRDLLNYDVNETSKQNIKNIRENKKLKQSEQINKIKEILLKTENLAIMLSFDYNICKLFIKNDHLKDYDFINDKEKKILPFLKNFIKVQFKYNSYTTHVETDLFKLYLDDKCSEIEIKTITYRSIGKAGHIDFSDSNNKKTKKYFALNLRDYFKHILNEPDKNQNKTYIFLFTTDIHYRFLILNNKSVFSFNDILDLNEILLLTLNQLEQNEYQLEQEELEQNVFEQFKFIDNKTPNSLYEKSIKSYSPNIPDSSKKPNSPNSPNIHDSSKKPNISVVIDLQPILATSKSPPGDRFKETKPLYKILNFPGKLNDLYNSLSDDKYITLLINNINKKLLNYEKLNKLKIIKKGNFYKFNYKNVYDYLLMLSDKDLKSIEENLFEI